MQSYFRKKKKDSCNGTQKQILTLYGIENIVATYQVIKESRASLS